MLAEMRRFLLEADGRGLLDRTLYSDTEWEDLSLLLKSEEAFYDAKARFFADSQRQLQELKDGIFGSGRIVIYGAGSYGCNLHFLLAANGIDVAAYADGDSAKWGRKQNGLTILSWQQCEQRFADVVYLIANKNYSDEIEMLLRKNHVPAQRIRKCRVERLFPNMI